MSKPYQGVVNLDVRDSTPDWEPYEAPKAREGMPNVLCVVMDDVGFSSLSCYGGPIETPTFDRIAQQGVRYAQWHTTALCSPTRACLLTGRNHTSNSMACVTEGTTGFPSSSGRIPFANGMLSEILVANGYNTFMLGKWHLTPEEEQDLSASKRSWPLARGFERYYGFLGGETNQWYPDLIYDNHPVEAPRTPEEGYHFTEDLTDKAIEFVRDAKQIAPDKPFFLYFAPGACHAPHHVWREWADKFTGKFDMGYERMREETLARQKAMGLVPPDTELPPINPLGTPQTRTSPDGIPFPETDYTPPWDSLSDDEKRLFARMAEVYAGFLSHADHHLGRILHYLEETDQLDNTLIIVVSDNGASAEGGPHGSVNEMKYFNGIPDSIEENMKMLDQLGSPATYNHYCNGWAMAFNTPFKMWKRYSSFNGGTSDVCIFSWPKGIPARGEIRQQYHHAIDIMPTILDCLGLTPPDAIKGYTQSPIEGVSMRYSFTDAHAPSRRTTQFYAMLGSRAIYHHGWKAMTTHPTFSGWGHFQDDTWELYHQDVDRSECHNLAEQEPKKLQELIEYWYLEAGRYRALPLDDRTPVDMLRTERPQPSKPRDHYVYFPYTSGVPESVAVNIRNRSFTIRALVDIADPDAHGMVFSQGMRIGGHALYVKDRKLHYVNNFVGMFEQHVVSDIEIPVGEKQMLSAVFVKQGEELPGVAHGMLTLYLNDTAVGSMPMRTQPGKFGLRSHIYIGRSGGSTVTADYTAPFAFTGGTIRQVVVDVSGTPYLNLEREAAFTLRAA